jgi:hypothetical protein
MPLPPVWQIGLKAMVEAKVTTANCVDNTPMPVIFVPTTAPAARAVPELQIQLRTGEHDQ